MYCTATNMIAKRCRQRPPTTQCSQCGCVMRIYDYSGGREASVHVACKHCLHNLPKVSSTTYGQSDAMFCVRCSMKRAFAKHMYRTNDVNDVSFSREILALRKCAENANVIRLLCAFRVDLRNVIVLEMATYDLMDHILNKTPRIRCYSTS